jgi:hypothetical protein
MQPKELHDFLFKLFDFAQEDMTTVPPADYKMGFMIMAYIEDIMDVYGRQLISQSAKDAGLNAEESLQKAHAKLDVLRASLSTAFEDPEMREIMDEAARRLKRNYGTPE